MSNDTLKELIFKARNLQLEHVEILDKYSITQVSEIYNGIGPDRFPAIIRKALNKLHPTLQVVALIHDLEYHEGGTREQFTAANDRFRRNCYTLVKDRYGWYDIRRYLWMNKARRWSNYCELFGWEGWKKTEEKEGAAS